MNSVQRSKLDACNRVADFNARHEAPLSTIAEYAAEQKVFNGALSNIDAAAQVQSSAKGTITDTVQLARDTMANTVIKYALRGVVKARQANNLVLANQLNQPFSYISKTSKILAIQRSNEILQRIKDNAATLTNITTANMEEIDNAIKAFDAVKDKPTIETQTRAATGTNPITDLLPIAFAAIDNMQNLIVSYFADSNKALVDEFVLARTLITNGVRHTGIEGIVTKAGNAIAGATINIGTDKTAVTGHDGHYIIAKLKPGNYTIEAVTPAGDKQAKNIYITRGSLETANFDI